MNQLLLGSIAMASVIIGLFFLQFWRKTGDRFFLFFACSFGLEGVNRTLLGLFQGAGESEPLFYLIRLLSFVLILAAVVDKNRAGRPTHRAESKGKR